MKKWNIILIQKILTLSILGFTPQIANASTYDDCCDPCCVTCCEAENNCCIGFGVDFIYWKPCVDDLDYAVKVRHCGDGDKKFSYRDICFDWEPGFRVRAYKPDLCCGWGIAGSYTNLYVSDKEKTETDEQSEAFSTLLHPSVDPDNLFPWDNIRGKYTLNYSAFDFVLTHAFCCGQCHVFTPFAGVEGVVLNQKMKTNMRSHLFDLEKQEDGGCLFGQTNWDSDYFGVGLKIGTEYQYNMYDCFSLFARGSGAILAGDADTDYKHSFVSHVAPTAYNQMQVENFWKFKDASSCHFVNSYHIQLGAIYDWNACGCDMHFRLGYEFVKYHNVPTARRFFVDSDSNNIRSRSTSTNLTTLGFHGILAGLDFSY